ncbi:major facilitator superfamily domain-containing protein [Penicillium longicatenatum]|nr:major facilitator superfamily domain-containing protein [Penicillium longicatenatum]
MIGFSAGGALGGFLATLVGWRWSFLLHVPIVLLCALVTVCQLPKDAPQDPQSAVLDDNQERQEEKTPGAGNLDVLGIMFLVCAIVSALMMVQVLQGDIFPEKRLYISTGLGAASLLLAGVFCAHEVHLAKRPLIPLSFMMSSQTGIVCAVQILLMIADLAVSYT